MQVVADRTLPVGGARQNADLPEIQRVQQRNVWQWLKRWISQAADQKIQQQRGGQNSNNLMAIPVGEVAGPEVKPPGDGGRGKD